MTSVFIFADLLSEDNWSMAIISSLGYGFFLALVSMSCGHDARGALN